MGSLWEVETTSQHPTARASAGFAGYALGSWEVSPTLYVYIHGYGITVFLNKYRNTAIPHVWTLKIRKTSQLPMKNDNFLLNQSLTNEEVVPTSHNFPARFLLDQ